MPHPPPVALYGPRTSVSLAFEGSDCSHELTLVPSSAGGLRWERTRVFDKIRDGKLFAPGNLRCTQVSRKLCNCLSELLPCRGSENQVVVTMRSFGPAWQDNKGYDKLVQYWLANKYTLRYTGGMVPDVNQILVKGEGIFTNPSSPSAPAKASRE